MFNTRRQFLQTSSCGFGYLAWASMASQLAAEESPLAEKKSHFPAKAKRVIFMFMQGAPSHVDTFDYKPELAKFDGKDDPHAKGKGRKLLKSPFQFKPAGQSGLPISELFPHLAKQADDLCLVNSMITDVPNHPQAAVQLHTGNFQFVRPSMGAWVLYGLGTVNQELPGYITINPVLRVGGAQNFGSAFLPAAFQATKLGGDNEKLVRAKLANINNPKMEADAQRLQLDLLRTLNQERLAADQVNNPLEGVIESYELAFRMQGAVPRVMDFSEESTATLASYGIDKPATDSFGRQCLLARRFAEAGVRFIEISMGGWDQHNQLKEQLTRNCSAIDQPIAALLTDLKQRGMLNDTLVVWGGEFGRTPGAQNTNGRDHNATGYSMWLAGGGVKGGLRYGATDEFGHSSVESKMHIHDLHATLLHLLGLDHTKLTYRYSGRDFRLTDVHGEVHEKIIA
jgi:hypothetical protein